eukprot:TRINITY_DN7046_c1_g1_i4.p1 TRINITY_DN7046_c1_g1~~TRINITY_DN7046_c1_g1_i4.p1  ORF type:complete len:224 (-),score=16.82 TRINITY_DN7046_c1_g1_i4:294-965(-)
MCPHPQPQICTPIIWWGPRTQPNFCLRFISPYFGSLFALLTVSVSHNSSGNSSGHYSDLIFGAWLSLLSSYLAILTDLSHNGESEIALVRFEGKNYTSWGYIDGSESKLKEDEKKISAWKTKNAKIKTWLLGFVEPHFILNLKPCKTAREMWDYLEKIMLLANFNWNLTSLSLPKAPCLSKNITTGFEDYGLNMMRSSLPLCLKRFYPNTFHYSKIAIRTNFL